MDLKGWCLLTVSDNSFPAVISNLHYVSNDISVSVLALVFFLALEMCLVPASTPTLAPDLGQQIQRYK